MKLTQRKLVTICDRQLVKRIKKGEHIDSKSYRRGFFNPNFKTKQKDSDK